MLEFGKRYTWKKIKEAYPNKFAFLSNIEIRDSDLYSGVLWGVCEYGDRSNMSETLSLTCSEVCFSYATSEIFEDRIGRGGATGW